jgi:signal transduction histidine kinase
MLQDNDASSDTPNSPPAARTRGVRPTNFARTGSWVIGGLLVYMLLATAVIGWERKLLFDAVHEIEAVHVLDEDQIALNFTVSHAILAVNEHYFSEDLSRSAAILILELDTVTSRLGGVKSSRVDLARHIDVLFRFKASLQRDPSRAVIAGLREALHQLVLDLDVLTSAIRDRKQTVMQSYRETFHRLTLELFVMMALGVGILGAVASLFFRHLSRDIGAVKQRAGEIVRGYRGEPLAVTRGDELGELMSAVNDMEAELKSRENQLELSRQQRFHTEKMAAVGSLAAAVAHEINNPLAAIVGVAESLVNERNQGCHAARRADQQIDLILDQARRVMTITRQIGEFSLQRPLEPALIDVNTLVRSTCNFISFDKRFRGIVLKQDLADGLPAPLVVSDHVVQVLMNLLINAADALEGREGLAPAIRVETRLAGRVVVLAVTDNGPGIASENLVRIFETHFTTKPPGRGSGLGLSLCRSLMQQDGGEIEVKSAVGQGTTVRVMLPVPAEPVL